MRRSVVLSCLLLLVSLLSPLRAADLSLLPDSTRWVISLDMKRFQEGAHAEWLQELLARPRASVKMAAFTAVTGVDLFKHITAMTLAGSSTDPKDGAFIATGTFLQDRLTLLVKADDAYQSHDYKDMVIHQYVDRNKDPKKLQFACFLRQDVLAISDGLGQIKKLIDVSKGGKSLLGHPAFADLGKVAEGSFLYAMAHDMPDLAGVHPRATLLQKVKDLRLSLRLVETAWTMHCQLSAETEEAGQKLAQLIQGLQALALLSADPQANPVLNEVSKTFKVVQKAAVVDVTASCPVAVLRQVVAQELTRREAERKAAAALPLEPGQ